MANKTDAETTGKVMSVFNMEEMPGANQKVWLANGKRIGKKGI